MLLRRLIEYSERLELPPPLYVEAAVRYIIELDETGRFLGITDTADPSSPRTRRGQRRLVPQVQRASGVRPLLLSDKANYVLGFAADGRSSQRSEACHGAFVNLVNDCAASTEALSVLAVSRFLNDEPLEKVRARTDDTFDPGATITFRVGDEFPIDLPLVQSFWATWNEPDESAARMQCVVCGHQRPVMARLQSKVKGVPGGQTSGTSIISANSEAFESYGLQASLIAPTCADCGERFTKALNDLLAREANRVIVGGAAYVFWTKEEAGLDLWKTFQDPGEADIKGLMESVRSGKLMPEVDESACYAVSISGSGGRTVVRDWLDTTVGEMKRRLATWFQGQSIADPSGGDERFYGLRALAFATVREPRDLPKTTPRTLLRAALTGTPLPMDILYQAVRRNRAEQAVTRPRAALIKLVLLSRQSDNDKEDYMAYLDADHPEPAYHCGRLLAVLEQAQRAAIPNVNATVVDRFYGTASTAPLSVFPRLISGAKPHLAKLRRDNRGAFYALESRIEEVLTHIPGGKNFPTVLDLTRQGLFALGYYHQRAHDRAQAREAVERRRSGAAPEQDAAPTAGAI